MQKMSVLVQNTQRAKVETEKALGALRQEVARARDSYLVLPAVRWASDTKGQKRFSLSRML